MFKIIFLCTFVVLISCKPSPSDDVAPAAVSSVNEQKVVQPAVVSTVSEPEVEPVLKTSEPQSNAEENVNADQLKAAEDGETDDKTGTRPLAFWVALSRLTSTTTAASSSGGSSGSSGSSSETTTTSTTSTTTTTTTTTTTATEAPT